MSGVRIETVAADEAGQRIDRWLRNRFPEVGHARVQKWLRTGQVRVDGGRVKAGARLAPGQQVRVPPLPAGTAPRPAAAPAVDAAIARELAARVLHRDDDVIVIDKPAGLAVQGGSGQRRSVDAALAALAEGGDERPRLVHRLDKDTSGVLVVARSAAAARALTRAFRDRSARKTYWAVVVGVPRRDQGVIDLALAKAAGPAGERVVADAVDGKHARTAYRVIDRTRDLAAWLELQPASGRTHQLRVHCAHLGTPILGDGKYGGRGAFLDAGLARRLHLHAQAIEVPHPAGGRLCVSAPLPPHFVDTFAALGFDVGDGAASCG